MIKQTITSLLVAIGLVLGGLTATAPPAHAGNQGALPKGCTLSPKKVSTQLSGSGSNRKVKIQAYAKGYCAKAGVWAMNVRLMRQIDNWPNSNWKEAQDSQGPQFSKAAATTGKAASTCRKPQAVKFYTKASYYRTQKRSDIIRESPISTVAFCR